jgi:hypothetical protein
MLPGGGCVAAQARAAAVNLALAAAGSGQYEPHPCRCSLPCRQRELSEAFEWLTKFRNAGRKEAELHQVPAGPVGYGWG